MFPPARGRPAGSGCGTTPHQPDNRRECSAARLRFRPRGGWLRGWACPALGSPWGFRTFRDTMFRFVWNPARTRGGRRTPYAFDCDSSQRAKLVKPTITASIQYWERTASRALS
jgi:hypothetical protein